MGSHGKRLEELEESEGAAGERESLNEEKVDFLTAQLKETEVRADAAERMNAVYTNTMVETENEISGWAKKTADMEALMLEMDNLADDPNYNLKNRRPPSATSNVSAKDMWSAKSAVAVASAEPTDSRSSSRAASRAGRATSRTPKTQHQTPSQNQKKSQRKNLRKKRKRKRPQPQPQSLSKLRSQSQRKNQKRNLKRNLRKSHQTRNRRKRTKNT